jgi:PAP_fibrillin
MFVQQLVRDVAGPVIGNGAVGAPSQYGRTSKLWFPSPRPLRTASQRLQPVTKAIEIPEITPPGLPPQVSRLELKAQLLDSLFGTERGLSASSEGRAEINEIITQVGSKVRLYFPTSALI